MYQSRKIRANFSSHCLFEVYHHSEKQLLDGRNFSVSFFKKYQDIVTLSPGVD
jgi:hypothetical protein